RIRSRYRSRGSPDALRPADLNRPRTSEKRKAQEHQHNQFHKNDAFEPISRDESNTLVTTLSG
ncbi:hypothetical protein A2U01_0063416, partial [Trifolium medium]|nr:hypothetical protein [Trifolium medium]